jgi:membrane-bound lytic murein transglycosylase D
VQRSLQYIPTIKPILKDQKLPEEIIFLPHVESSYTPYAESKVGAVGLWQIMPKTMAQLMGEKHVGNRKNVSIASVAAAKLLRMNYKVTKSWPLALTAYNHGLGGIQRAMKKTDSRDLCTIIANYDSASFRFASSNFYAQFLAAKNISKTRYKTIAKSHPRGSPLIKLLVSLETPAK